MYLPFRISSVFIEFIRIIRIKKKNPLCEWDFAVLRIHAPIRKHICIIRIIQKGTSSSGVAFF